MRRQISSKATFFSKIISPMIVLFFWGAMVLNFFFNFGGKDQLPLPVKFIFLGLWFVVAIILYFTVMKFMAVSVDENFLYVSNYLKEIQIPLSNIQDVTEIVWLRGHPVTIHLKNDSEFGRKITFMPQVRAFAFFSPHPIVDELKTLANLRY